jgi:hypothetical protein
MDGGAADSCVDWPMSAEAQVVEFCSGVRMRAFGRQGEKPGTGRWPIRVALAAPEGRQHQMQRWADVGHRPSDHSSHQQQ